MAGERSNARLDVEAAVKGIGQINALADEIEALGGDASELRGETEGLSRELERLQRQQGLIETFESLSASVNESGVRLEALGGKTQEAAQRQIQLEANLRAVRDALTANRAAITQISAEQARANVASRDAAARYEELRTRSREAGKGNTELAEAVRTARQEMRNAQAVVSDLGKNLGIAEREQKKLERAAISDEKALARQSATVGKLADRLEEAQRAQQAETAELQRSTVALKNAGIDSQNLASAQQRIQQSSVLATTGIRQTRSALEQQRTALQQSTREAGRAAQGLDKVSRSAKTLVAGFLSIRAARELIELADAVQLVDNRLKLVTQSEQELTSAQNGLLAVAQKTRAVYSDTADLFITITRSTKQLGLAQDDVLGITETVNQAIKIANQGAESSRAAIRQLVQGLQSGTLRGEELNSVLEQTPRVAQALADGLGVSIGKLRELGKDGALSTEQVINALRSQADAVREEFEKIGPTVADNVTVAKNSFQQFVAELNKQSGTTSALGEFTAAVGGVFESLAINLQLAREEQEKQAASLFKVGDVAKASAERVREFASAQAETSAESKALSADLTKLQEEIGKAGAALKDVSAENLSGFAERAGVLFAEAQQQLANLRAEFPALQSATDEALARVDSRFADVLARVKDTGTEVDRLRNEQLRRLGVDAEEALTGIDSKARDLLETFKSLISSPETDPRLLAAAFDQVLESLDSPEELRALKQLLEEAQAAGGEFAIQLDAINAKLDQTADAAASSSVALTEATEALKIYLQIQQQLQADRRAGEKQEQEGSDKTKDKVVQNEKEKAEATVESTEKQKEANSGVAKFVFDLISSYRQSFAALSDEAAAAFDAIVEKQARANQSVLFFLRDLNAATRDLKRIQEDQSSRADSLVAQLSNVNTATRSTIITATRAAQAFDFVDKQRLDNLNAAIDGARSRMESLQDSARSTFESLRDELDRLQGNEEAIEARRRAAQRAQIQAQLATARTFGDRETVRQLEQSLAILQQIEREQRAIAQANGDATSATRGQGFDTESAQAGVQSNSRNSGPGFFQRPARTTRIEFVPPGSSTPISGDFDDDDADRLLDLLGQQKAVSTR